jgi:hypothetical protein
MRRKKIAMFREVGTADGVRYLEATVAEDILDGLVWHSIDKTRILTPSGELRTMRQVGRRFNEKFLNFEEAKELHHHERYDPSWFKDCPATREFDYEKIGSLVVRRLNSSETDASDGNREAFYICDGCHRMLVLAVGLLRGELEFRPIRLQFVRGSNCPETP